MLFIGVILLEFLLLFFSSRFVTKSLSLLFFTLTKSKKATIYLLAILFFPGTVIHELAHFLVAQLLFVHTGAIEFLPHITPHGVKLGSVQIEQTDPIRRFFIGIAPILVGIGVLFLLFQFIESHQSWYGAIILVVYAVFEMSNTMFSSRKDVEGAWQLLLVVGVFIGTAYFLGVRLPEQLFGFLASAKTQDFLLNTSLLLLIPLALNISIYGLARAGTRR